MLRFNRHIATTGETSSLPGKLEEKTAPYIQHERPWGKGTQTAGDIRKAVYLKEAGAQN
jgi:hypothetical protein